MYNKVELCGVNTAELPVLSEQEKRQLLTRARAGDQSARQSMIEGNLRLVLSVVQRFAQRGENLDDLFQVGCIGLIKAIDNFDPAQEVRFSTYGVPMIIGEIRRFLRDDGAVKVSRSVKERAGTIKKERQRLMGELGREPTLSELSDALGIPPEEIASAEMATGSAESIQRQTGEEGITLEDGEIHADEIAYVKEDKSEIGIEIHSGRNRIVRRIFESLGYSVRKLDRVYYAGLTKKNLKRGAWRFLTKEEVMRLKSGQYE